MAWPTFPILGTRLVSAFRGDFNDIIGLMLSAFTGATEPTQKYPGQFWVDTSVSPKLLKQRNTTNTAWIVRARVDSDYGGTLPISGGTMEGAINMNGYAITNLPLGAGNAPARYTDLANYALLDGTAPFTGIPTLPALDPSLDDQAARKAYVDARAVAGGTYTAQISLPVAASAANHAMRKNEVDSAISSHTHSGAAGQGVKIGVGSLSVYSGQFGDVPRITSEGGSQVIYAPPIVIENAPGVTLLDITANLAWYLISVGAQVPAHARAVILQAYMQPGATAATIKLRRYQSTDAGVDYSITGHNLTIPLIAPLYGTSFEVSATLPATGGRIVLKYIGWM